MNYIEKSERLECYFIGDACFQVGSTWNKSTLYLEFCHHSAIYIIIIKMSQLEIISKWVKVKVSHIVLIKTS